MGVTINQLKELYPNTQFDLINSITLKDISGNFIGNDENVEIDDYGRLILGEYTYRDTKDKYKFGIWPNNSDTTLEDLCSDKVKILLSLVYNPITDTYISIYVHIYNNSDKALSVVFGAYNDVRYPSGNPYIIQPKSTSGYWIRGSSYTNFKNVDIVSYKYPMFLYNDYKNTPYTPAMISEQIDYMIINYNGVYDSSIPDDHKAIIYPAVFLDTDNPPIPERPDYMDLNVPGNSEQPNARYEFVNPVAGLAYTTAQKIIFDWDITGATKNPYVKKHVEFNIPANSHCFVLFTGKYVGVYCTAPTNFVMDVYNGNTAIGQVTKQSAGGVLEIQDLFGMYEGYEPVGGVYNVKIQTPFVFIRQIYKCASRDQLPQKGSPTYEIFQPGTSSAYVNPNDTGELAAVHFLKAESLAALKAAADAEYKGGGT